LVCSQDCDDDDDDDDDDDNEDDIHTVALTLSIQFIKAPGQGSTDVVHGNTNDTSCHPSPCLCKVD